MLPLMHAAEVFTMRHYYFITPERQDSEALEYAAAPP